MTRVRQVVEVTTIRSRPTGVKSPGSVVVEDLDAGVPRADRTTPKSRQEIV